MKEIIKTKNEPYNKNNLWLNDGLHEYKDGKWTSIGGGSKYYYYNYRSVEGMNAEGDKTEVDTILDISDAAMYITEICYNTGNSTDKVHTNLEEFLNAEKNAYWSIYYFCTNEPLTNIPTNYFAGPAPIYVDCDLNSLHQDDSAPKEIVNILEKRNLLAGEGINDCIACYVEDQKIVYGSICTYGDYLNGFGNMWYYDENGWYVN